MNATGDRLSSLMERYARGEDRVFEPLYGLVAPRLYRFCLRLASSVVEADDCFQEMFLKLHRARATYVAGANPLHWAFAIARSVYLSRLRYWRRRPEQLGAAGDIAEAGELQVHDTTPEAEVAAQHLHDTLTFELGRMSEKNPGVAISPWGLRCLFIATVVSVSVLAIFASALRRAVVVASRLRGAALGAASGAWGGLAVFVFCPSGELQHLLVGHVLPIALLTLLGAVVSMRIRI